MEKRKVAMGGRGSGNIALFWAVLVVLLGSLGSPAWAGVSATISQGWPEASPDTVNAGGNSTLYYTVTITGLNPNESVSSQIISQSYAFATDQQTTINGVVGQVVVTGGPASASTFAILVVGSSQVEGQHSVSFDPGSKSEITLSDGTEVPVQSGTPAPVDTFTVAKNVVTVTGDPYCIIPGDAGEDWTSDVTSTYTATANFSLESFSLYHWSGSSNAVPEAGETPYSTDGYEGAPAAGNGDVKCTVYGADGNPYSGDAQVTVDNQFTWNWNPSQLVVNTGIVGGENISLAANASTGDSQTSTYSVTSKAALSASFTEADAAAQSLSLTLGFTYTGSSTQTDAYANNGTQPIGVCIGQELTATAGTVIIATPQDGPGTPQNVHKYAMYGNGLSVLTATLGTGVNGFTPYTDPGVSNVYDVP